MEKLVSVIIPCYNAEKWLREAIDSCLNQTYANLEIIVIDDGSSDHSLEIIKSYEDKVIWESGPNRGGCYARNRGFELTKGEYIQYLDADDYLLPQKIERQVHFLEETGADVVYGDWRPQKHLPDGTFFLKDINTCGPKDDFLEHLLADKQWLVPHALIFTRDAVSKSGGWDEKLKAGQDRDFFISVAMSGVKFAYQPGCYSVYRGYGNITVSTSNPDIWRNNHFFLMEKAEMKLSQLNKLSERYRRALAECYFGRIRGNCTSINYSSYLWVLNKITSLCPDFKGKSKAPVYNIAQITIGFKNTEIIYKLVKQLLNVRPSKSHNFSGVRG